jgi:outer membrane immunogenic protein
MQRFASGLFTLTVTIAGIAGIACAAELPPPPIYTKAPIINPPFSWTGFYIGANAGYAWGTSSDTNPFFPISGTGNFGISGVLAGGQVGYNWQFDAFVLGLESDGDWSGVKGSTSSGLCGGVVCTTSDSWLGTTRARLGFAVDHWLFYGTGGVAYGDIKFTDLPAALVVNGSNTNVGWTAGGGIEYAFTRNWSAKAEYLYVNLGSAGFACTPGCGTSTVTFNENIFRGGLNYRF